MYLYQNGVSTKDIVAKGIDLEKLFIGKLKEIENNGVI